MHAFYVGLLVVVLLTLWTASDVTWWGTVLAFGPRWVLGLPLLVLLPVALGLQRKLLLAQGLAAALFAGPVMGMHVGTWPGECPTLTGLNLRVVTCNVRGETVNPSQLAALIAEADPGVVALQECPPGLPERLFDEGWFVETSGQLCVASRFPIVQTDAVDRRPFGGWGNLAQFCRIESSEGPFELTNVHFMTVRPGLEAILGERLAGVPELEANTATRRRESEAVSGRLAAMSGPQLVTGDFNLPVESVIYRDYWSGYTNSFSSAGFGFGRTWQSRWYGVRIDHVLVNEAWEPVCCRVGPDVGSDHRPVIAELRRVASIVESPQ